MEIRNYGLIRDAAILFDDGATIFTGETGSGKTMILGALAFALGARASADLVGKYGDRTIVTLAFEPGSALAQRLELEGFETDPGEDATIEREITAAGKSSVRLNGRASTAAYVRALADDIAEIVGQHEAQRLLAAAYHLELLDRFGGETIRRLRETVEGRYAEHLALQRRREELAGDASASERRYLEARAALDVIDSARPEEAEDERLETRRRLLDNAERVATALQNAHGALAGEEYSGTSALGVARAALDGIREFSPALSDLWNSASALQEEVTELAARIAREASDGEFDARELESVNERLDVLDRLKRAYGGSLAAVFAHAASARAAVDAYENQDHALAALDASIAGASAALARDAEALTQARRHVAADLAARVHEEFPDLSLGAARFEVRLTPLERIGAAGAEVAEFFFAANAGETPKPLAKVASGGELSRVLLALIVATSEAASGAALVFDEIDTGIGGATGAAVGARLDRLARRTQVVCVTHLAQLAMWADRHYVLEKSESAGATEISVNEVRSKDDRAAELARMLSGESHDVALAHARTLLAQAAT